MTAVCCRALCDVSVPQLMGLSLAAVTLSTRHGLCCCCVLGWNICFLTWPFGGPVIISRCHSTHRRRRPCQRLLPSVAPDSHQQWGRRQQAHCQRAPCRMEDLRSRPLLQECHCSRFIPPECLVSHGHALHGHDWAWQKPWLFAQDQRAHAGTQHDANDDGHDYDHLLLLVFPLSAVGSL